MAKNPRAATKTRKHHSGGITPKMERFIDEYTKDLNATAAAQRAGYSHRAAGQIARRVLDNPEVQKRLTKKLKRRTRRVNITVERVLAEYAAIAFANPLHYMQTDKDGPYVDLEDLPDKYAAALSELSFEEVYVGKGKKRKRVRRIRFKMHSKTAALDSLGKYLEMFKDKGDVNLVVTHDVSKVKGEIEDLFSEKT